MPFKENNLLYSRVMNSLPIDIKREVGVYAAMHDMKKSEVVAAAFAAHETNAITDAWFRAKWQQFKDGDPLIPYTKLGAGFYDKVVKSLPDDIREEVYHFADTNGFIRQAVVFRAFAGYDSVTIVEVWFRMMWEKFNEKV